jgi:predicted DNA binding protein
MTYYELSFRLQHACPYNDFSRAHPSVVLSHWCNWSRDILEVHHPDEPENRLREDLRQMFRRLGSKPVRSTQTGLQERIVIQHCACDQLPPPTLPTIEKRDCLNLLPMVYSGGWEMYRIVAFSDEDVRALFRELERKSKVELVSRRTILDGSIHESLMVSTSAFVGGLTGKQVRALVAALDHGYYTFPRRATSVEIAHRLGTPRTSFVEHLRKGQNKVIAAVGPYLRMRTVSESAS